MKTKPVKIKLMTVLLTFCMVLSLVPLSAFALEQPNPEYLPQGITYFTENKHTYHTQVNVTANVSVKDSNGTVIETTQVSKSTEVFLKGAVGMLQSNMSQLQTEIEAPYQAKGTITRENGTWQPSILDHFEKATFYTFTPASGDPVKFSTDLDAAKQYFSENPDAIGTFTELLDMHEYQKRNYTYDLTVQQTGQAESAITAATIENVKFSYQPGDAPKKTALVAEVDTDKYEIEYECWQEFENNEPVAAWYSDNGSHGNIATFDKFESGKKYVYSILLKPKAGYSFSSETVITVNGQKISVPFVEGSMYIPSIKTINIPASTAIDLVEIENVTVSFKYGDKPVFTGKVPDGAKYAFRCEWWSLDSNTGLVSTEPEWGSEIYKNKITVFEAGKTYHYGVFVSAYYDDFSSDARLKINGQYVKFKRIGDENDTQNMWLETELTMTPQASGTALDYKFIEGADGAWTKDTDGTLTFRANGEFSKFTGVKIDGISVASDNYTAVSGSTVITLKKNYLETLSVGNHTLTVMYNDGECSTEFTVNAAKSGGTKSPKTGYYGNLTLWIAMLFISGGAIAGKVILTEKKKQNR